MKRERIIIPNTRWPAPDPEQLPETAGPEPIASVTWLDVWNVIAGGFGFIFVAFCFLAIGGGM